MEALALVTVIHPLHKMVRLYVVFTHHNFNHVTHDQSNKVRVRIMVFKYFSYIGAVSFTGGENH